MNARAKAARLDLLDHEIAGLARLRTRETIAALEAAGFDATGIRPLPYPHPAESNVARLARTNELAREHFAQHGAPRRGMGGTQLLVRHATGRVLRVS